MDDLTYLTHDDHIGGEQISRTSSPHAGDFETVQYILTEIREGPNPDDIKQYFSTAIFWACIGGYPDIIACLLEHGAPITYCASYATSIKDTDSAIRIYDVLFKHGLNLADYPGIVQYVLPVPKIRQTIADYT